MIGTSLKQNNISYLWQSKNSTEKYNWKITVRYLLTIYKNFYIYFNFSNVEFLLLVFVSFCICIKIDWYMYYKFSDYISWKAKSQLIKNQVGKKQKEDKNLIILLHIMVSYIAQSQKCHFWSKDQKKLFIDYKIIMGITLVIMTLTT